MKGKFDVGKISTENENVIKIINIISNYPEVRTFSH